jgi:hypothetical protein
LRVGLLGFVVLVIPSAIGVAFGGGDPGLMYLTFLGALLWLFLGALLLAATLLRRGVFRAGRRFAGR